MFLCLALFHTDGWWLVPLGKVISNDYSKHMSNTFHSLSKIIKFWYFKIVENLKAILIYIFFFSGEEVWKCSVQNLDIVNFPLLLFLLSLPDDTGCQAPCWCFTCIISLCCTVAYEISTFLIPILPTKKWGLKEVKSFKVVKVANGRGHSYPVVSHSKACSLTLYSALLSLLHGKKLLMILQ